MAIPQIIAAIPLIGSGLPGPRMFRPTNVRHHVAAMQSRGFAADAVLEGTGIEAARLNDPSYLVDLAQHQAVIANMIRLSDDPALGLAIGMQTMLTDLGIVGYAMSSASTMGQALGILVQYSNSPVGFPVSLKLVDVGEHGGWGVKVLPSGISGTMYRFYVEQALGMGFSLGPLLMGELLELQELTLSYPPPTYRQRYEELFHCPIRFNADETRIVARAPRLDAGTRSHNSELRELCLQQCSAMMQKTVLRGQVSMRLRALLRARGRIPSLNEAASSLRMSSRSLRRHLRNENTSFQAVLDEFRSALAREYLTTSALSIKEVAYLLGFSQVDAFRRAFKQWTGQTAGQFQAAPRLDRH